MTCDREKREIDLTKLSGDELCKYISICRMCQSMEDLT